MFYWNFQTEVSYDSDYFIYFTFRINNALIAELHNFAAHCVRVKQEQVVMWRLFLGNSLYYFLAHYSADYGTRGACLSIQISSAIKDIKNKYLSN